MDDHTLQQVIDLAVKLAVQKAKLDMHPIGKTWLTFGDENPADIVGGVWERVKTYCLQCSDDDHAAGTVIEAGLPNIKGKTNSAVQTFSWNSSVNPGSGAIITTGLTDMAGTHGTGYGGVWIDFDASKSNSIYGKSETVQPNTVIINVWKRVS